MRESDELLREHFGDDGLNAARGCVWNGAVGLAALLIVAWALGLFGPEPVTPPPVEALPTPCEYPMALNYLGDCVPSRMAAQ